MSFKKFVCFIVLVTMVFWTLGPVVSVKAQAEWKNFDVVINEVLFDVTGVDDGYEWIELYNRGPDTVDISTWSLKPDLGSYKTFPANTTIASGAFYQVTGLTGLRNTKGFVALYNDATIHDYTTLVDYLQYADSLSLIQGDADIQTAQDHALQDSQWPEDAFIDTSSIAADAGKSIGLTHDGVDMNNPYEYSVFATPTLGAKNDTSAPTVIEAFAPWDDTVVIRFSEDINISSANFVISPSLAVTDAFIDYSDPEAVRLWTAIQTADTSYTITINGVTDMSGNAITADTTVNFTGFNSEGARIDWIEPAFVAAGSSSFDVIVHGLNTNFVNGTSVGSFDPTTGITVNSTTVSNATTATINIDVASDAPKEPRKVTVTTGSEVVDMPSGIDIGDSGRYGGGDDIWLNGAFPASTTKVEIDFSEPVRLTGINGTSDGHCTGDDACVTIAKESDGSALSVSSIAMKAGNDYTIEVTTATQEGVAYEITVNNVVHKDYDGSINVRKVPSYEKFHFMGYGSEAGEGGFYKPHVVFTEPWDGAMGIPTTDGDANPKRIIVEFSEPMDSTTITTSNLVVSDGSSNVGGTWSYKSTAGYLWTNGPQYMANSAVFTPDVNLKASTNYYVDISTSVKNSGGTALEGNKGPGQGHTFTFSTMMDMADFGGTTGFMGFVTPPYVEGSVPFPGAMGVPKNGKLQLFFSEAMDASSINNTYIKLYRESSNFTQTEVSLVFETPVLDSATNKIVTFQPDTTNNYLSAGHYILKVLGGVQSQLGITAGPPDNLTMEIFRVDFDVENRLDTEDPTVIGIWPADGDTNIPVGLDGIEISFSKPMDASTIKASNITLKSGTTDVAGRVKYEPMSSSAYFIPSNVLASNRDFILTVSTNVKDIAERSLASASTVTFTTGNPDTQSPSIVFADADTYGLRIEFSEPMNSAGKNDTANYANSVMNSNNYNIKQATAGTGTDWSAVTALDLSNVMINYMAEEKAVMIDGLNLTQGNEFKVVVSNAVDLSGNTIGSAPANTFYGPIMEDFKQDEMFFGGGMNMGPETGGKGAFMAFAPVSVFPMNMMANATTTYFIDIPITTALSANDKIQLIFPSKAGFDVSSAAKDANSPANTDINGSGPGTIGFSVDTYNVTKPTTISITIDTATNSTGDGFDFLHFDLSNIVNASVAKEFGSSGYTVKVKTIDVSDNNKVVESLTSMPVFITKAGTNTINVQLKQADGSTNLTEANVEIRLDSPMSGPQKADTNSSGLASFSSLPDGEYYIHTEPVITISSINYKGADSFEPVYVSGSESKTRNITLKVMNSANGFYSVQGAISGLPANEKVAVWASSWQGWMEKSVTVDGSGNGTYTLWLENGEWDIGLHPFMEMDFFMGPPPPMDWLPPVPIHVKVNSANLTGKDLAVQSAGNTLTVYVQDAANSDQGIKGAFVHAFNPYGSFGFGNGGETDATGKVELKLMDGKYMVEAFVPGLSPMPPKEVIFPDTDASPTTATVTLKLKRPGRKITGQVIKGSTPLNNVPVFAQEVDVNGNFLHRFADGFTDSSTGGQFTLYVDDNTYWQLGAYIPGYGETDFTSVHVETSDLTGVNIQVTSTDISNLGTVSGTVKKNDGTAFENAGVWAEPTAVNSRGGAGTATAPDGSYSLQLKTGSYTIHAGSPEMGELGSYSVSVDSSGSVTESVGTANDGIIDFVAYDVATVTIDVGSSVDAIYVAALDNKATTADNSDDQSNTVWGESTQTVELKLPYDADGDTYELRAFIPGKGEVETTVTVSNASSTPTVDLSSLLPTTVNITGEIYQTNASSTKLGSVLVSACDAATGFCNEKFSDPSDGTYSIEVPANTTYTMTVSDVNYVNIAPQTVVVEAADVPNQNFSTYPITDTTNVKQITGTVYRDSATAANKAENNAVVWAVSEDGQRASAPVDENGDYTLYVENGKKWTIEASAEGGYGMTALTKEELNITDNVASKDLVLTQRSDYTITTTTPRTVGESGIIGDKDNNIKVKIDRGALSGSKGVDKIMIKETTNFAEDPSSGKAVGQKAISIEGFDESGGTIGTLSGGRAIIERDYSDEVTAGNIAAADVGKLKMTYFDSEVTDHAYTMPTLNFEDEQVLFTFIEHFSNYPLDQATGSSPPSMPTGVSAAADSSSQITVSWTAVSGAGGYDVYYKKSSESTYAKYGSEPSTTSTSLAIASLDASTTYNFRVSATDGESIDPAESAASSAVSATTQAAPGGGGPIITTTPGPEPEVEVEAGVTPEKPITAMTIAEIKNKIAEIQAMIVGLQAQLKELLGLPTYEGIPSGFSFTKPLKRGSRGDEVKNLQIIVDTTADGIFGPKTEAAVKQFQIDQGITVDGIVGPQTREKLNDQL